MKYLFLDIEWNQRGILPCKETDEILSICGVVCDENVKSISRFSSVVTAICHKLGLQCKIGQGVIDL